MIDKSYFIVLRVILPGAYEKYSTWFKDHPGEEYCYWTRDNLEPISIEQFKDPKKLIEQYPDLAEDIRNGDHTRVYKDNDTIILRDFCPRIKAKLDDVLIDISLWQGIYKEIAWSIETETDHLGRHNYVAKLKSVAK